jgi:sortase A
VNRMARLRPWLAWTFLVFGLTCITWCGWVLAKEKSFQNEQSGVLERELSPSPSIQLASSVVPSAAVAPNLIGRLEIPRVKLSAMVVEGDDEGTLNVAVGHLPDTPFPWQSGNSALAGHRDTFFRPLKDVHVGDEIVLTSLHGELHYRVDRTVIVDPQDLSVLKPSSKPTLTLVTCFPFFYVGHAPRRFVVQASRLGAGFEPVESGSQPTRRSRSKSS